MSDRATNKAASRKKGEPSDMERGEDRLALEKRIADAQASMQGRLKRIEREVGSGPKAILESARKHPTLAALAAVAAGVLAGKTIARRRAARRARAPGASGPAAPPGARSFFWSNLLRLGIGLAADFAADFLAERSGDFLRRRRKKKEENDLEKDAP